MLLDMAVPRRIDSGVNLLGVETKKGGGKRELLRSHTDSTMSVERRHRGHSAALATPHESLSRDLAHSQLFRLCYTFAVLSRLADPAPFVLRGVQPPKALPSPTGLTQTPQQAQQWASVIQGILQEVCSRMRLALHDPIFYSSVQAGLWTQMLVVSFP